jgi:hypothetical protein
LPLKPTLSKHLTKAGQKHRQSKTLPVKNIASQKHCQSKTLPVKNIASQKHYNSKTLLVKNLMHLGPYLSC